MGEMNPWKALALCGAIFAAQVGAIWAASAYMHRQGEENMRKWREDQAKKGCAR